MSIDGGLNAGLSMSKRPGAVVKEIEAEADFYGIHGWCQQIVRGDAIAGIVITWLILWWTIDWSFAEEPNFGNLRPLYYTMLTIGDGLLAQIPALIFQQLRVSWLLEMDERTRTWDQRWSVSCC